MSAGSPSGLPDDPMMLLGVVNMQLRDYYPSLDELCRALDVDRDWLTGKLAIAGFEYSEEHNRFW